MRINPNAMEQSFEIEEHTSFLSHFHPMMHYFNSEDAINAANAWTRSFNGMHVRNANLLCHAEAINQFFTSTTPTSTFRLLKLSFENQAQLVAIGTSSDVKPDAVFSNDDFACEDLNMIGVPFKGALCLVVAEQLQQVTQGPIAHFANPLAKRFKVNQQPGKRFVLPIMIVS